MTTLAGITDTAAVEGLKAVEDTAIATLVAIERAYEAAMAHVADLAANRVRVLAPQVAGPRVVLAQPAPVVDPEVHVETRAGVEIGAEAVAADATMALIPEQRVSPLVEALQALQVVDARAEVAPEPQPAPGTDVFPVVEVIERPRLVDAVWIAGRHAEAKTDQIPVQAA
jgi:hypothetical protein